MNTPIQINTVIRRPLWLTLALAALCVSGQAQNASWTNLAGGDWNTAVNWDVGVVPGVATNVLVTNLAPAYTITYASPMSAASIASLFLTNGTATPVSLTLNINAAGFNVTGNITNHWGSRTVVGAGGVVNCANWQVVSNGSLTIAAGAIVTNTGTLAVGTPKGNGAVTNNGGILVSATTTIGGVADGGPMFILGGTNFLGTFSVARAGGTGNSAPPGLTSGLVISNGLVTMTSAILGSQNSWGNLMVVNGTVTNTGDFAVARQITTTRGGRFTQFGGLVVSTTNNTAVRLVAPPATTITNQIALYAVLGGTNIVEGFTMGDANIAPPTGGSSTVNFTNAGTIVVGSVGIVTNWGNITANLALNNGGIFAAKADWATLLPMLLSGTFTFNAGDLDGTPHNITLSGALRGAGASLAKSGSGTLTLNASNTYTASTLINGGSLVLGPAGAVSSSQIIVGSAGTFDVSGVSGGFVIPAGQTLQGSGVVTGTVTCASVINPGSNALTGTLTLTNDLIEAGGATNHFDLSNNPLGPNNDLLNVGGTLALSGTNYLVVSGSLPAGSTYALIHYGNISGDVTNFQLSGATGVLSNSVATKTIDLVVLATIRGPTNVVWVGNPLNTNWDTQITTNWLNAGSLDYFVSGDNTRFDATGAANPLVNLTNSVVPGSVTVDGTNYTFAGIGSIDGIGLLLKTNSGTLTILSTNGYSGPTVIVDGALEAYWLANGGSSSSIGSAINDPSTLTITNATLRYLGPSTGTDRGATVGGAATLDIPDGGTTLTMAGQVVGNGVLTKTGTGTLTLSSANTFSGGTTISNGTLTLNNASGAGSGPIVFASGTLNLIVGAQPTYGNALSIPVTSTLISAGGNNNIVSGSWTGDPAAVLNVSIASGGTFTVNGSMTNFPGTIELGSSAGTFRFNSGGGNTSFGGPNTTFDLGTGTASLQARNPGTMTIGALVGGSGTFVRGEGAGSGTLIWAIGNNNASTTYPGTIVNGGASDRICALTKIGSGTLTLSGQNTYTGTTTINSGTLALTNGAGGDGSIADSASINVTTGTFLDVSGRSDGTLTLGSGQTLIGRGTISGTLDTSGGGMLAPGGGVGGNTGTFTVTNASTLGGSAWMKLNRANNPNSDRLVSPVISLGGSLVITNIGARLQVGDTFTLFSGSTSVAGSFTSVVLPNYYTWNTNSSPTSWGVSVASFLPLPQILNFSLSSGSVSLDATNGAPNGPLLVLSSTNVTLPLSSWTPVATNAFDANGVVTGITFSVDPNIDQQYYTLLVR